MLSLCSITTLLYDGRPEERKGIREEYFGEGKYNVLLTHYDLIMKDKKFLKKIHWHYMIVDEGHRLKNHECALSRTIVTGYVIVRLFIFSCVDKLWLKNSVFLLFFAKYFLLLFSFDFYLKLKTRKWYKFRVETILICLLDDKNEAFD